MTTKDENRHYDVRTLERRLRKGVIQRKDLEKYLKGLPDVTSKVAPPEETEQGGDVVSSDEA